MRLIDADSLYTRVVKLERDAHKSFPDYKRGIEAVEQLIANAQTIDVDALISRPVEAITIATGKKSARCVFEEAAAAALTMDR